MSCYTPAVSVPKRHIWIKRAICAVLLIVVTAVWLVSQFRLLAIPLLILCYAIYAAKVRKAQFRFFAALLAITSVALFSPVDVSLIRRTGRPHMVPLVMGLPSSEDLEQAKRGEVIIGGCMVSGNEPKYLIVW